MNYLIRRSRQFLPTFLLLLCFAWAFGEAAQQLLSWHAQHLLADIRAIEVNHTTWFEAVPIMQKWSRWGAAKAGCSEASCDYRINLVRALPPFLIGTPEAAARNFLPRLIDHVGLRTAAVRAGLTVEHGIVTSKWFAPPVSCWASA